MRKEWACDEMKTGDEMGRMDSTTMELHHDGISRISAMNRYLLPLKAADDDYFVHTLETPVMYHQKILPDDYFLTYTVCTNALKSDLDSVYVS